MKTNSLTTDGCPIPPRPARFVDRLATVLVGLGLLFVYSPFAHADSTYGPWNTGGTLRPNGTDSLLYTFNGGEEALLAVSEPEGDGDLTVAVYDEDGFLVAIGDTLFGSCVLTWTPPDEEQYTVHVFNSAGVFEDYRLVTN